MPHFLDLISVGLEWIAYGFVILANSGPALLFPVFVPWPVQVDLP